MRHSREIVPASHQSRPVHVHQRVRDVQILRAQLVEELGMRQSLLPLVQVVYMRVPGVPSARWQIQQAREPQRDGTHAAGRYIERVTVRHELEAADRLDHGASGGDFHGYCACSVEVVRLGGRDDAMKATRRCVRSAITRFHRNACWHRAAVRAEHPHTHLARRAARPRGVHRRRAPEISRATADWRSVQRGRPRTIGDERHAFSVGARDRCILVALVHRQSYRIAAGGRNDHHIVRSALIGHEEQRAPVRRPRRPRAILRLFVVYELWRAVR